MRKSYPIHFENIGDIEALDVFVTDVLDMNLDASTLQILTPGGTFEAATRTVGWNLIGRNLQPGETGNVLFSIRPLPGLPSGTEIRNRATIQFEIFDPITTNEVVNIIDSTLPSCTMDPLPEQTTTLDVPISWSGTDAIGEIDTFTVFVSVDGGNFTPFLERTRDTSTTFRGETGKTYGFLCIATDTAGNVEVQDSVAEAVIQVVFSNLILTIENAGVLQAPQSPGSPRVLRSVPRDQFWVSGEFLLGNTSDGIALPHEEVTVTFGTFRETIPAGAFFLFRSGRGFRVFKGIRGATTIYLDEHGSFSVAVSGVDLGVLDLTHPVPFSLQIGNDLGETEILFDHEGHFQK